MPTLPEVETPTVDAIYKYYEMNNTDSFRDHLGASLIGEECERKLWYTFRWATKPKFDGRILRLFQTGFREEARIIDDLRAIGITIYDRDPETGKQIQYGMFGNHFGGSVDAIGQGFPEAPVAWHVVEIKTSNARAFKVMQTKGVAVAKPLHYAQIQLYMSWSNLDRAMYLVVCKDTDEIYSERIHYDKDIAERLRVKAHNVIFSPEPLERIGTETDFRCKFCDHKPICHNKQFPEVNCRTCAFSDAMSNGDWNCCRYNHKIEPLTQRNGCPSHAFIPALVPLQQIDADVDLWTITYEGNVVNGQGFISSKDMGCRL